ncbi:MAG: hypothetical protein ACOCQR_01705 [bacterium]
MKCPKCDKQISSKFMFFLFKSHPFKRKCKKCNASLKPNKSLKKYQWLELISAVIFGVLVASFGEVSLDFAFFFFILIFLIPLEYLSWTKGEYIYIEED